MQRFSLVILFDSLFYEIFTSICAVIESYLMSKCKLLKQSFNFTIFGHFIDFNLLIDVVIYYTNINFELLLNIL